MDDAMITAIREGHHTEVGDVLRQFKAAIDAARTEIADLKSQLEALKVAKGV